MGYQNLLSTVLVLVKTQGDVDFPSQPPCLYTCPVDMGGLKSMHRIKQLWLDHHNYSTIFLLFHCDGKDSNATTVI